MNKPYLIIANWKMKLGVKESVELSRRILAGCANMESRKITVVLCPSFTSLNDVHKTIMGNPIRLGAQDIFWEEKGSFTGEITASQLKEVGCSHVLIGHSERRQYLNESDEMVHQKVKLALSAGLIPIVCVGETYEQRADGQRDYVISRQIIKALEGVTVSHGDRIIIAYEPVWVIGRGQAVSGEEMKETGNAIKQCLVDIFPDLQNQGIFSIIYGGSVDESNAMDFIDQGKMDGVLVGTASWSAEAFLNIISQIKNIS